MIDNSKNVDLVEAYKTANGIQFYTYQNPLAISALRGLAAEKANRFLAMNLTERSLKELINEYKIAAKENDVNKFHSIIYEIDYRLQFLCEENSILDLVCIYFFLKDEDPTIPSEYHNKEKHKIFENDLITRSFFLQIGLTLCKKFNPKQEKDMLNYLEENKKLAERILMFLPRESFINSIPLSTS